MGSVTPRDYQDVLVGPGSNAAPIHRTNVALGQFTANTTVTKLAIPFDRAGVLREIWVAADAIPSDADGTLLLNCLNYDISEAAADSIVASADLETLIVAAKTAYQCTFAAETSENERTVAAGDVLYFTLVNNSAAIDTNPALTVSVIWQPLAPVRT